MRAAYAWTASDEGYRDPDEYVPEFDRWLKQIKAETFAEGFYYASNGKWGNLMPGENPYE